MKPDVRGLVFLAFGVVYIAAIVAVAVVRREQRRLDMQRSPAALMQSAGQPAKESTP